MGNFSPTRELDIEIKGRYNSSFVMSVDKKDTLETVFDTIIEHVQCKYNHMQELQISYIYPDSFTGEISKLSEINEIAQTPISTIEWSNYHYNRKYPAGILTVRVTSVPYKHKVFSKGITCEHMNKIKSTDALSCPVYYSLKEEKEFTQDNLYHLNEYNHFNNEYEEKPICKSERNCKVYLTRLDSGDSVKNACHMKLYSHPPRTELIQLQTNIRPMILNTTKWQNRPLYEPSCEDDEKYKFNQRNGYIQALIEEVIKNGYVADICNCAESDECKHNKPFILNIVKEKMQCRRHKKMGNPLRRDFMLALILYTDCACNYDLCKSQRDGNLNKWKWFDYCLYWGIRRLSKNELGSYNVFSGLSGVQLGKKEVKCGYFVTYVSTSWSKEVAKRFITSDEGMLIELDKTFRNDKWVYCCDVSWISRFPDEREILFARALDDGWSEFKCMVRDESDGIQVVSLTKP